MNDLPAWPEDLMSGAEACDEFEWLNKSLTAAMARIEELMIYTAHVPYCAIRPGAEGCTCGLDELLATCRRNGTQ